jgi:nuclear pore complex protein Nup133
MFEQEAQTGHFMDAFFKHYPNVAVSWIYDLGKSSYTTAAVTLLQDSENAGNIDAKHVCVLHTDLMSLTVVD